MRTRKIVIGALRGALPLAMLMAGATDSLAASAGSWSGRAAMPMGAVVPAPRGFVAFCERNPIECPHAPLPVTTPFMPGVAPFRSMAGRFYNADAGAFDETQRLDMSATRVEPASAPAAAGWRSSRSRATDWSGLFAAARLEQPGSASRVVRSTSVAVGGVPATGEMWATISRVNKQVNKAIIFREDDRTWGARDYWTLPLNQGVRSGDCEDYVLEKRRALLAAGVPKEALSIALVITPWGESHAVLLVGTEKGEMVLDNLSPWIVPWTEAGYRWLTRQAPGGDAMTWVSVPSAGA